ncbi:hypothetical protein AMTRI_Chr10g7580 [Amborella trichopoda]
MEEYLQHMKNLRSQMNGFEEQLAEISVEEHKQKTCIQAIENDLQFAKSETARVEEETTRMENEKGEISCQILDIHKNIVNLETQSSGLTQSMELLQQETASLFTKIEERRNYFNKVLKDLSTALRERQDSYNSQEHGKELKSVVEKNTEKRGRLEGYCDEIQLPKEKLEEAEANKKCQVLMTKIELAKAELQELTEQKSKLASQNSESKQTLEQLQRKLDAFPPELKAMDIAALEEEHKALISDKAGEISYLQSLQERIEQLNGISQSVKCACGEEYKVEIVQK